MLTKSYRIIFAIILSVSATIGGGIFFLENSRGGEESLRFLSEEELKVLLDAQQQEVVETRWLVDVAGEVNSPGVIEIEPGLSLLEVIEIAGGFTKNADQRYIQKNINLSQEVEDRQKIYIPSIQENQPTSKGSGVSSSGAQINLNTASVEELDSLDGIGPSTAQKIIDARPFKSVDELKGVAGIGDSTFEKIKTDVTI